MATVAKRICDACGSDKDVDEMIVSYRFHEAKPWCIDLCGRCYKARFEDVRAKQRPVKRANIRPQYRIKETILTPDQL